MSSLLEYSRYRDFLPVIDKAKNAINNLDEDIQDHMEHVLHMVEIGSGAKREVEDVRLSWFAC